MNSMEVPLCICKMIRRVFSDELTFKKNQMETNYVGLLKKKLEAEAKASTKTQNRQGAGLCRAVWPESRQGDGPDQTRPAALHRDSASSPEQGGLEGLDVSEVLKGSS